MMDDFSDLGPFNAGDQQTAIRGKINRTIAAVKSLLTRALPAGGSAGQVLTKTSGNDFEFTWQAPTGGSGSGATNLSVSRTVDRVFVVSDTGLDAEIPPGDASQAGILSATQAGKLANVPVDTAGALAGKAPAVHTHAVADLSDASANGRSWLQAASYAAMKALLGLVKADVGLGSVDNTSDASKPISTLTQAALDGKAPLARAVPAGGTTGQVLKKASAADYDATWQADNVGAGGGGATNLSYTSSTTQGVVNSDTGTGATIPAAGTNAGLMLPAEKTKLAGIAASADVTATALQGAAAKTAPVDADTIVILDSAASSAPKLLSWANLKATLKTYLDTLYQPVNAKLTSFAALAFGTNGQVLSIASGALAWSDPAAGGGSETLIGTLNTASQSSVTQAIPAGYKQLRLRLKGLVFTSSGNVRVALSSDGSTYGTDANLLTTVSSQSISGEVDITLVGEARVGKVIRPSVVTNGALHNTAIGDFTILGVISSIRVSGSSAFASGSGTIDVYGVK